MRSRPPDSDTLAEFIVDPQGAGVWCARIDLEESDLNALGSLLNLRDFLNRRRWYYRRHAFGRGDPGYVSPAIIVPRLLAYLRACLPQTVAKHLPPLVKGDDTARPIRFADYGIMSRWGHIMEEVATIPRNLGPTKKQKLSAATKVYGQHLASCTLHPVPENGSKLDIWSVRSRQYLQATEAEPAAIKVFSPSEGTVDQFVSIIDALPGVSGSREITKVFSPEDDLMPMYLPALRLVPLNLVLRENSRISSVSQALEEAQEERFTHSIRATGIATEELVVEIYETYLRQKAPEAPLGTLLSELGNKIQAVLKGRKIAKGTTLSSVKKSLGQMVQQQKKKARPNKSLLELAELLQQNLLPLLDGHNQLLGELASFGAKAQRVPIFPSRIQHCANELVALRNRVSHRVGPGSSVATVGHVEAAIALRDFIVAAHWWEHERPQLDFKGDRKSCIQESIKRSKATDDSI